MLGMGSLLGQASQAAVGTFGGLQNQYSSQNSMAMAQQQHAWAQQIMGAQQKPQWVFNGITCNSAREMADIIWENDCAEKTWFILKFE